MPLFKRKPVMQRILELTQRYQKRHPAIELGELTPGRISLDKRFQYHLAVTKLLIKDRTLRKCFNSKRMKPKEKKKFIADYALKKAGGNRENAINFLDKEIQRLDKLKFDERALEAEARKKGFKGPDIEVYAEQTKHMYGNWVYAYVKVLFQMAKQDLTGPKKV